MSPKITVHGGVTNAFETGPAGFQGAWSDDDTSNVWPDKGESGGDSSLGDHVTATGGAGGGEQPSPGNSSSPSAEKQPSTDEPTKQPGQRRARGTANRSKKRGASSTAPTADDAATS